MLVFLREQKRIMRQNWKKKMYLKNPGSWSDRVFLYLGRKLISQQIQQMKICLIFLIFPRKLDLTF